MANPVSQPARTAGSTDTLPARSASVFRATLSNLLSTYSTALVVLVLLVVFSATAANFGTSQNLVNIVKQMSIVAIVGIGMTMVILIGGIDLSVGSVILLTGGITSVLMYFYQVPPLPAIAIGLVIGVCVGLFNGLLVEVVGISPVIATLGTLIALRGLGQIAVNNTWVFVREPLFEEIAAGRVWFVPNMVVIMLLLYAVAAFVMRGTSFGRYIYAIGGNPTAARLAALPVVRTKILVYMLSGFFAAIGGMLTAATLGLVGPPVGQGVEFDAIAAVVLGGTRLGGGAGRVERTLLGALILQMVLNYMTLRGIPDIWQATVTGFIVLGAVLLDRIARRTRETV